MALTDAQQKERHNVDGLRERLLAEGHRRGIIGTVQADHALRWYDLEGLQRFLAECSPHFTWDWQFSLYVQSILAELTPRSGRKIVFEIPIRHGKTELITKHYPMSLIASDPRTKVGLGCHTADLAAKFGRSMLKMARRMGVEISKERATSLDWETTEGGGFHGTGVDGPLSGYGFHQINFDDPIKNRKVAESLVKRDAVWDWMQDDLLTRKEEAGANVLGVMSRWHEDDPVGRIEQSEDADTWEIYFMPALAEKGDILGRTFGEAICPSRFDADFLRREKVRLGPYAFSGLYQQRPVPREGAMFDISKIKAMDAEEVWNIVWPFYEEPDDERKSGVVREQEAKVVPRCLNAVLAFDLGATVRGDDTAGGVLAGPDPEGTFYITDFMHGDWEANERNKRMEAFVEQFPCSGRGAVRLAFPQDPGAAGKEVYQQMARRFNKYAVLKSPTSGSKELRADGLSGQVNAGNVAIARLPGTRYVLESLRSFPLGANDHAVDWLSDAYNHLTGRYPQGGTIRRRSPKAF